MYCRQFQAQLSKTELAAITASREKDSPDASEVSFFLYCRSRKKEVDCNSKHFFKIMFGQMVTSLNLEREWFEKFVACLHALITLHICCVSK